jgi:hypothetical protein
LTGERRKDRLLAAAPFDPLKLSALGLLSGKTVAGWPSGSALDSEETMSFSALSDVRPRVETFKLEQAEQALARALENRAPYRRTEAVDFCFAPWIGSPFSSANVSRCSLGICPGSSSFSRFSRPWARSRSPRTRRRKPR